MTRARLAGGGALAFVAFLFGVPFVPNQNSAVGTILDIADFICQGARASAGSTIAGGQSGASGTEPIGAAEHEHAMPPGLYMPMFSTPPEGGAVYNGPPLDQC